VSLEHCLVLSAFIVGRSAFIPGDTLPRYTHDILVDASIPRLVGINTALEVDLTGQMNAEVAERRHVGMVGGHGDFKRGCLRSHGGLMVTTPRSDADIVVTEYGIAEVEVKAAIA
jgi:acyl-CoA hydrolase